MSHDSHRVVTPDARSIAELRAKREELFKDDLITQSIIIFHDAAAWKDLLIALDAPEFVRDQAAFRLHKLLSVRIDGVLQTDPAFWKSLLEQRNLNLDEAVSPS